MDFNELLKPAVLPNDIAVINRLKASDLPVVLYGASVDVADQIVKKLSENNISLTMVVYDEESPVMTKMTRFLKDFEPVHLKDAVKRLPTCHVILGFVKAYSQIDSVTAKFQKACSVSYFSEIFDMEVITPSFIVENDVFLRRFYDDLGDQHSKASFVAYLLSKTRQDMKYLPPVFDKYQYFPKDLIRLTDRESYVDCGAFTGDTIADFLQASGGVYERIWAVEPDRLNYEKLIQYIENERLFNIEAVNKGVYSHAGYLPFQEEGSMLSMVINASDRYVDVDTIDHITDGKPVTYIKLDVEGVELQALKGAEQTIRTFKPVLGISIYHKEDDLITIPSYVKAIVPEYAFYFRVHKKLAIDTVLYAMIK